MGKIRVKTLGDADQEKKQKQEAKQRAEAKKVEEKKTEKTSDVIPAQAGIQLDGKGWIPGSRPGMTNQSTQSPELPQSPLPSKPAKKAKFAKNKHSASYQALTKLVDAKKIYNAKEALSLLSKLKHAQFDETVELHLNTTEIGVTLSTVLPHGTGKTVRVLIADEAIINEIEKGQINFDILVAEPMMMPKLAKVARILGPKGLMPNPKNGTVTQKPEEAMKRFMGGQVNYKTEAKFPIMHMSIGKMSFGEEKLMENLKAIAEAMQAGKVKSASLKLTMSPSVHLDFSTI